MFVADQPSFFHITVMKFVQLANKGDLSKMFTAGPTY